MRQLLRARFIAPTLHAILFAVTTYYVVLRNLPILDPPALLPVAVLFFADFPMSVIAAGVIFTSPVMVDLLGACWEPLERCGGTT